MSVSIIVWRQADGRRDYLRNRISYALCGLSHLQSHMSAPERNKRVLGHHHKDGKAQPCCKDEKQNINLQQTGGEQSSRLMGKYCE